MIRRLEAIVARKDSKKCDAPGKNGSEPKEELEGSTRKRKDSRVAAENWAATERTKGIKKNRESESNTPEKSKKSTSANDINDDVADRSNNASEKSSNNELTDNKKATNDMLNQMLGTQNNPTVAALLGAATNPLQNLLGGQASNNQNNNAFAQNLLAGLNQLNQLVMNGGQVPDITNNNNSQSAPSSQNNGANAASREGTSTVTSVTPDSDIARTPAAASSPGLESAKSQSGKGTPGKGMPGKGKGKLVKGKKGGKWVVLGRKGPDGSVVWKGDSNGDTSSTKGNTTKGGGKSLGTRPAPSTGINSRKGPNNIDIDSAGTAENPISFEDSELSDDSTSPQEKSLATSKTVLGQNQKRRAIPKAAPLKKKPSNETIVLRNEERTSEDTTKPKKARKNSIIILFSTFLDIYRSYFYQNTAIICLF